jgi:hypothetical protein
MKLQTTDYPLLKRMGCLTPFCFSTPGHDDKNKDNEHV